MNRLDQLFIEVIFKRLLILLIGCFAVLLIGQSLIQWSWFSQPLNGAFWKSFFLYFLSFSFKLILPIALFYSVFLTTLEWKIKNRWLLYEIFGFHPAHVVKILILFLIFFSSLSAFNQFFLFAQAYQNWENQKKYLAQQNLKAFFFDQTQPGQIRTQTILHRELEVTLFAEKLKDQSLQNVFLSFGSYQPLDSLNAFSLKNMTLMDQTLFLDQGKGLWLHKSKNEGIQLSFASLEADVGQLTQELFLLKPGSSYKHLSWKQLWMLMDKQESSFRASLWFWEQMAFFYLPFCLGLAGFFLALKRQGLTIFWRLTPFFFLFLFMLSKTILLSFGAFEKILFFVPFILTSCFLIFLRKKLSYRKSFSS
jgi:hypothetical protein